MIFNFYKTYILLVSFFFTLNITCAQEQELITVNNQESFDKACLQLNTLDDSDTQFIDFFGSEERGIVFYTKVLEWAEGSNNLENVILAKHLLLRIYLLFPDDIEVISRSKNLLSYPEIYEQKRCVEILYTLKEAYRRTEQFQKLVDVLYEYHERSKQHGYIIGKIDEFKEIANVHYSLKNYDKAILLYKKAAVELKIRKKYLEQSSALNDLGLCFENKKKLDSAQYYYKQAIQALKNRTDKDEYVGHFLNILLANEVGIRVKKGENINPLPFFKEELQSAKIFKERHIIISAYYKIAKIISDTNPEKALKYLDSAKTVLKIQPNTRLYEENLVATIQNYIKLDKKDFVKHTFNTLLRLQDSIKTNVSKRNYMISSVIYETDQKIEELKESKNNLNEEQNLNYKLQFVIIVFVLLTIALIWTYKKIKKNNQTIISQKEALNRSLSEKETLLKEVHHRIKNNLQVISSLLNIHSGKTDNREFQVIALQSQRHISAMSLVHEMLYQNKNITSIDMDTYFKKLCHSLMDTYPNNNVQYEILVEKNIQLNVKLANPIGLVINELISNSMKYAFKNNNGTFRIMLINQDQGFQLTYTDNGPGIDENKAKTYSFGERLITLFAEEMNAEMKRFNDNGLSYTFTFKQR